MGIKIHFKHAADPLTFKELSAKGQLKEKTRIKVACGRELINPIPVYMIDYDLCDIVYSLTGVCGGCRKVNERERYLYGLVEGQEARLEVEQEIRIGEA